MAETEGIIMNVLDIGAVINHQIEKHFPKNVEIIAEPGRFLVASCETIVTRVISTRT